VAGFALFGFCLAFRALRSPRSISSKVIRADGWLSFAHETRNGIQSCALVDHHRAFVLGVGG
jgi:hypothetical protein